MKKQNKSKQESPKYTYKIEGDTIIITKDNKDYFVSIDNLIEFALEVGDVRLENEKYKIELRKGQLDRLMMVAYHIQQLGISLKDFNTYTKRLLDPSNWQERDDKDNKKE